MATLSRHPGSINIYRLLMIRRISPIFPRGREMQDMWDIAESSILCILNNHDASNRISAKISPIVFVYQFEFKVEVRPCHLGNTLTPSGINHSSGLFMNRQISLIFPRGRGMQDIWDAAESRLSSLLCISNDDETTMMHQKEYLRTSSFKLHP